MAEGEVDEGFFFEGVGLGGTGCGAGGGGALDTEDGAVAGYAAELGEDVREGSHIGGLFLCPHNFCRRRVVVEGGL